MKKQDKTHAEAEKQRVAIQKCAFTVNLAFIKLL